MYARLLRVVGGSAAALALVVGACESGPVAVSPSAPATPALSVAQPRPLPCPTQQAIYGAAAIGSRGGVVRVQGFRLTVPPGAVPRTTTFELLVPASRLLEVDVRAVGSATYEFQRAVSITMDYSRCARTDLASRALTAWFWDPETRTLLEPVGGTHDPVARTVTFSTRHLSGYVIAD